MSQDDERLTKLVHDLRTPLTVVAGFAELLVRRGADLPPEQRDEYLSRIVDDHEALREGLEVMLTHSGHEVLGVAGNVAAALDLLEVSDPDIAIVDIQLPDGSGIDLTRELLARNSDLAVILYTGDSDAELLYSGLDSGARGYALKAGSMAELVGAIERIAAGGPAAPASDRCRCRPGGGCR